MSAYDVTLVTCRAYDDPQEITPYIQNVLLEDQLVSEELEKLGLRVYRTHWDDENFDWSTTRCAVIRATWDYFHRYPKFSAWLKQTASSTILINDPKTLFWNIDKHYLNDLSAAGVQVVETYFIEIGDKRTLKEVALDAGWEDFILKPAISGGGRHTYKTRIPECEEHEEVYKRLIAVESMLIQPFQTQIVTKGEVSHMIFGGEYSHAVLKIAKPGDFRVQDDFGGTIHPYMAMGPEVEFATKAIASCSPTPLYARVDVLWNNDNELALAELELIEPELWFREKEDAAPLFARAILSKLKG
jgi:hypothetical protein